jgi:ATP-dependent helicase/nuclease subunit A
LSQIAFNFEQEVAIEISLGADLTEAQAKIRDHEGGNQVVVAGAGTGKTEALTQRILRLLLQSDTVKDGATLDSILALTFTDKAAAEMRSRVYAGLVRALRNTTNAARKQSLEKIRSQFTDRNKILTFDSFNRRILTLFPDKSSLNPGQNLLNDADRFRLRADLTRAFWDRCEAFDDSQKENLWEFLARFPSRSAALEAIETLAQNETPKSLELLQQFPIEDAYECDIENLAQAWERNAESRHQKQIDLAWQRLNSALDDFPELPPRVMELLRDPDALFLTGVKAVVTKQGEFGKAFFELIPFDLRSKAQKELLPPLAAWKKLATGDAKILPRSEKARSIEYASRRAVAFLASHALWWQSERKKWCDLRNLADFSDIADAALALVQQPEVARALQKTLTHILIDEFQDTNGRQWELIDAIRDRKRGNVLIVGDEKQAIYGFRGGDMTVFDRVRRVLLEEKAPHELVESHRSTASLVNWTNEVFERLLPSQAERETYEAPFQKLESTKENSGQHSGLWKLSASAFLKPDEAETLGKNGSNALATARFLRELCDDAAEFGKGLPVRQAGFQNIAELIQTRQPAIGMLFTSHIVKAEFESALRKLEVPFTSVKGIGFFQSEPVIWTLHLLGILLDPTDEMAFTGLARSPLGALSDVALLERKLGKPFSRSEDSHAFELITKRLEGWRLQAKVSPFSQVLENVLEQSEIAFYEAGFTDFAQREQNWRKLADLIRSREGLGLGGLRDLYDFLRPLYNESTREADAALPSDGSIQLMTVHAAKGLGFPMVIVAQLDKSIRADGSNLLRGESPNGEPLYAFKMADFDADDEKSEPPLLYTMLQEDRKMREVAESKRTFYVACTRARESMVFVWPITSSGQPAKETWADWIGPSSQKLNLLVPSRLPQLESRGIEKHDIKPLPPREVNLWREEIGLEEIVGDKDEQIKAGRMRSWLEKRVQNFRGDTTQIRENVPFCVSAEALQVENVGWVYGAFDWLARLGNGSYILLASGEKQRVEMLAQCAYLAGLEIQECWEANMNGDELRARRVALDKIEQQI